MLSPVREDAMNEPWFGPKTYGIGIGPKSRAGWISVAVYCALMAAAPFAARFLGWPVWAAPVALGLLTVGFLILVALKSDGAAWRWRWRWGGR
jgi:hypothetical protein